MPTGRRVLCGGYSLLFQLRLKLSSAVDISFLLHAQHTPQLIALSLQHLSHTHPTNEHTCAPARGVQPERAHVYAPPRMASAPVPVPVSVSVSVSVYRPDTPRAQVRTACACAHVRMCARRARRTRMRTACACALDERRPARRDTSCPLLHPRCSIPVSVSFPLGRRGSGQPLACVGALVTF